MGCAGLSVLSSVDGREKGSSWQAVFGYGCFACGRCTTMPSTLTLTQIHAATVIVCRRSWSSCVSPSLACFGPSSVLGGLQMPAKSCRIIQGSRVLSLGRAAVGRATCRTSLLPRFTATSTRDIHTASILIPRLPCSALPASHSRITSVTHHRPLRAPDDWPLKTTDLIL